MSTSNRNTPRSVLLVDDDFFVLEAMAQLLDQAGGFTIHRAADYASASTGLKTFRQLDVIVTDVVLAGLATGLDLCREAMQRFPHIGVIVVTGDISDFSQAISGEAIYLRKPFSAEKLLSSIRSVVEHV